MGGCPKHSLFNATGTANKPLELEILGPHKSIKVR